METPGTPSRENPGVGRYVWRGIVDEAIAFGLLLRREWRVAAILLAVVVGLVVIFAPFPPSVIRMAKGQPNSGLEVMARKYAAYLATHGVRVEFVDTDGAPDSLRKVASGAADAGLSQSGLPAPASVHYLGSVALQPFWLFHAGARPADPGEVVPFLVGKRVSVGVEGSGSHAISGLFLDDVPQDVRARIVAKPWNNANTVRGLKSGELDAAFLLASFESGNAQSLLKDPRLHLVSFSHTRGFANLHGFLQPVTLPSGSLKHYPANPPRDVAMFAASMTLVVRSDLHPATQKLLLAASRAIAQRDGDIISRQREFPTFVDPGLTRSPVAVRYYQEGEPLLMNRLPYWLASLIDTFWVSFLAFMALAYPLMRAMPRYRALTFSAAASHRYRSARALDRAFSAAPTPEVQQVYLREVQRLLSDVRQLWVPNSCSAQHGSLLSVLLQLEQKFRLAIDEAQAVRSPSTAQATGPSKPEVREAGGS